MKNNGKCCVGARVIISAHHWLRPYENGLIIDRQNHGQKRWLVQFDEKYPGGGTDGDKLWLDERDFAEVNVDTVARSASNGKDEAENFPLPVGLQYQQ